MDARILVRLTQLRQEFETGQTKLRQLEVEQDYLRERLLMLKGAISVLEDLSAEESANGHQPGLLANASADRS